MSGYTNVREAPVHKSGSPIELDNSTRCNIHFQLVERLEVAQMLSKGKVEQRDDTPPQEAGAPTTQVEEPSTEEESPVVWYSSCTPGDSETKGDPQASEARVQEMCEQHGVEYEIRNGVASSPLKPSDEMTAPPPEAIEATVQTLVDMGFTDRALCTQMVMRHKDIKKCVKALIQRERQLYDVTGTPEAPQISLLESSSQQQHKQNKIAMRSFPWDAQLKSMMSVHGLSNKEQLRKQTPVTVQGDIKQAIFEVNNTSTGTIETNEPPARFSPMALNEVTQL